MILYEQGILLYKQLPKELIHDISKYISNNQEINGLKEGIWKICQIDSIFNLFYKKDKLHGHCEEWHKAHQIKYEYDAKEGKAHGIWREYYDGKLVVETNYKENKKHGVCKKWFLNGQLADEMNYKEGKCHGIGKRWYENGQLHSEQHFKNNICYVTKQWSGMGQLVYERLRFENVKPGSIKESIKEWYKDGQLKYEFYNRF